MVCVMNPGEQVSCANSWPIPPLPMVPLNSIVVGIYDRSVEPYNSPDDRNGNPRITQIDRQWPADDASGAESIAKEAVEIDCIDRGDKRSKTRLYNVEASKPCRVNLEVDVEQKAGSIVDEGVERYPQANVVGTGERRIE